MLRYAVVTPARDEENNLPRLADSLAAQTVLPDTWAIVENGSSDRTREIAEQLSTVHTWVLVRSTVGSELAERGAPVVRAFTAGLHALDPATDIVVNVDADVSMEPDYFERLLAEFEADPHLGIASGSALEEVDGVWRQRFVTGSTVWGATRAYRRVCLEDVLPLEERHGWDGLDQLRARSRGWRTRTIPELTFRHHRREGERDSSRVAHWRACGESAHFMGYRSWYLLARAVHNARHERAALAMVWGFAEASLRGGPRYHDEAAREKLRRDQRLRNLWRRRREALGLDAPLGE